MVKNQLQLTTMTLLYFHPLLDINNLLDLKQSFRSVSGNTRIKYVKNILTYCIQNEVLIYRKKLVNTLTKVMQVKSPPPQVGSWHFYGGKLF